MLKQSTRYLRGPVVAAALLLLTCRASAQTHSPHWADRKWLVLGEEQYRQKQYRAAEQSLRQYLLKAVVNPVEPKVAADADKARYYLALSLLKQQGEHAGDSALVYLSSTANQAHVDRVSYALAHHYFETGRLAEAIPFYENANIDNLSNEEIADSKFELAYSYFNNREFDKAEPLFASIKEVQGKYYAAGNYYYGLLEYNSSKYDQALKSFERIDELPQYRSIVPYYIAEIHYFKGNRQKALEMALQLIRRKDKLYYDNELHLLAAQCLFEEQRYGEALPYFEHYYSNTDKIRKEELYEMAYCHYRVNEWKDAIDKFKPLSAAQDSLGQTAMYLLGDCYLKTGDKRGARNAFGLCSDMNFNAGQREAALLLNAKLSYEEGYNDEAARRIGSLLSDYPQSAYRSEAKTLMSGILLNSSHFSEALAALEDVSTRDNAYWNVNQKAAYGFAIQRLQLGYLNDADSLLKRSLQEPVANNYAAAAHFWRADIAQKQNRFSDAAEEIRQYQALSRGESAAATAISAQATPANANLLLGYALLEQKDFSAAQRSFQQARQAGGATGGNAILREADAVFMQKDFNRALGLYDQAITAGADADYARLQKAIILGLQGKNAEKSALLQTLISKGSGSARAADARYELGLARITEGSYQEGIDLLQPLTEGAAAREYAPKAWFRIGFAYRELDQDAKSIEAYRRVVTDYPASTERAAALEALRGLYVEQNNPQAYADLLKSNNLLDGNEAVLDSTFYAGAEKQYADAKYAQAAASMGDYLSRYPNGAFAPKAHYYKAESHYQMKQYAEALKDYDAVLSYSWSDFTEASAKRAAALSEQSNDPTAASIYYEKLRQSAMAPADLQTAYLGLVRSNFQQERYREALNYADTLLTLPELSATARAEVALYKGKAMQKSGNNDGALEQFKATSTGTAAVAAEGRYQEAAYYLSKNQLKEAEETANAVIRNYGGQEYWVVKSYLLLADVLVGQKDYFNAKATLQSLVKNVKNESLKAEATKKLETVTQQEKKQSKLSEE